MVKVKKKNLSESAQQKNKKQLNPFEVHINRDKQKVLGRKSKNDRGLPGVSRAKAINRRKQSLLQEYKLQNKDNVFLDKRIGERNNAMSIQDKAIARFAAERIKSYKKESIFNLNDEILTHRGQTLEEIEKFDDPRSDDELSDSENISGKLDKDFVEDAHFGGGTLSKTNSTLSRKNLIDQLIAESKKRKAERQKIREQTIDLTEKLDSEWRDLLPVISASKNSTDDNNEITKPNTYDIAVRQLKFEARGNPSEKLKSEEEVLQEEKEKLERLEADRLARMKGFVNDTRKYKHKSADDLEDDFVVETIKDDNEDSTFNINNDDHEESNEKQKENELDSDKDAEEDADEEMVKEVEIRKDNKNQEAMHSESLNVNEKSHIDLNDKDLETENLYDESEDDLSDLKMSGSSSEDEGETQIMISEESKKCVTFANNSAKSTKQISQLDKIPSKSILKQNNIRQNLSDENKIQQIRNDLLERKEIMEKARKELPYTYNAPDSFEELEKLLQLYSIDNQSMIIDRIIKCNHWILDGKNKEKMSNLFVYLLQYIDNCAYTKSTEELIRCFQIFDRLCPYFYDLAHMSPENAKNYIQEVIKEKYSNFENNKTRYPGMDTLIFFKLVSLLFPTSDFRHPVVTPCLVFMSEILLRARIKKYRSDISKGLFICTLILEYTVLSKRFAPSVINFLRGIIYMATPADLTQKMKTIPPFKIACNALVINKTENTIDFDDTHMFASDLIHEDELDDKFKIRVLLIAINLLIEFKNQLQELEAVYPIFEHIFQLLKINKFKQHPQNVRNRIKQLYKELKLLRDKKLEYIVVEKKRPKPLKTYEPKIVTIYDGKRHKSMSKEKAEREKLLHKYKKEFKGAIREIRRDRDFLAKIQIGQQIKNDTERKRKVNEIFGQASVQQSELKKIKKKK